MEKTGTGWEEEEKKKKKRRVERQGKEKPVTGYIISKAFNQEMENLKANLNTAANKGGLTSHQMTVCIRV